MTPEVPVGCPRATVIIPTYGHAPFVRCAIESVQAQTVRELEICVILDGSPASMSELVDQLAVRDPRIRVFRFPKAPRTGEIHRASVIHQTRGRIICYLSHDDLWLPRHVELQEHVLEDADFSNSIQVNLGLGEMFGRVSWAQFCNLAEDEVRRGILGPGYLHYGFGLSFTAHTRDAYFREIEGWTAAPEGVPTDMHMWRKFLGAPGIRAASVMALTALHFPASDWRSVLSAEEFEEELRRYVWVSGDPDFHESLVRETFRFVSRMALQRESHLRERVTHELDKHVRSMATLKLLRLLWRRVRVK